MRGVGQIAPEESTMGPMRDDTKINGSCSPLRGIDQDLRGISDLAYIDTTFP